MLRGDMESLRRLSPGVGWFGPLVLGAYFAWQFKAIVAPVRDDVVWVVLVAGSVAVVSIVRRRAPSAVELMALEVLAATIVADIQYSANDALRDLRLYLDAGREFLAGGSAYTTVALHAYPADSSHLPFLYAPPTLPLFGLLSALPFPIVAVLWVGGSVAAVLVALRAFGLSWPWAAVSLLWYPIEQGLFTGNVAAPSLVLLGAAVAVPASLPLGALLKPQNAIVAAWLIRRRDWRPLAWGAAGVAAVIALTLPLTGIWRWEEWVRSLLAYQASEQNLHGLYGVGLARYLPLPIFIATAVGLTLLALGASGRIGLARLGLASVVASPSLWSHGFVIGIPAFLMLRASWFWLVAGLLCVGGYPGPQVALLIGVLAWIVPLLRRDVPEPDAPHPLGDAVTPWPAA
jgi:glycosyl transferase family 87